MNHMRHLGQLSYPQNQNIQNKTVKQYTAIVDRSTYLNIWINTLGSVFTPVTSEISHLDRLNQFRITFLKIVRYAVRNWVVSQWLIDPVQFSQVVEDRAT